MKGIDYNKALSRDRNNFNDTIKKTQDSAEKRVTNSNQRADEVVKKQRENFIEDKAELESNYQSNLQNLTEKARDSQSSDADRLNKEILKERENFTQQSLAKKKEFDQRLGNITDSYKKSFDSERDGNSSLQTSTKDKYQTSIANTKDSLDKKLSDYKGDMTNAERKLKDSYLEDRQKLVKSHDARLLDSQKDSGKKNADLRGRIQEDIRKSKEVQSAEADQHRQYTSDQLKQTKNNYEDKFQKMDQGYTEKSRDMVTAQQKETIKGNAETQAKLTEARQDYVKDLRRKELDLRRKDVGSGEYAKVMNRQQGRTDEELQAAEVKGLKGEIAMTKQNYQDRFSGDQKKFNEDLRKEKFEGSSRLDRKLGEVNADKVVTVSKEREKNELQIENREHQNRLEREKYEQQLMLERNNGSDRMSKLKENFNKSMKNLEDKFKFSIDDVKTVSNKDKGDFVKRMEVNRTQEMFELKREFGKMMDSTIQSYEQRLGDGQRDNEYLKLTMQQKITDTIDQTSKQLETQRTLFEERRSSDVKGAQILTDQKEHALKTAMNQMNVGYQKKIDKMQVGNDTKLKLLTNDYENKLNELKASTSKELASKEANQQIELDRIKNAFEDEKTRTVQAFESQIDSIKIGHRDQMDQMKDFKRLS